MIGYSIAAIDGQGCLIEWKEAMEHCRDSFQEQMTIFSDRLAVFKTVAKKHAIVSNEVDSLFAEIRGSKANLLHLQIEIDNVLTKLRPGNPIIPPKGIPLVEK